MEKHRLQVNNLGKNVMNGVEKLKHMNKKLFDECVDTKVKVLKII